MFAPKESAEDLYSLVGKLLLLFVLFLICFAALDCALVQFLFLVERPVFQGS